ncbi:DUF6057 family protein [Odoribacter lunatus]|uniref:DUF6057 family protein n=1 Tax=Odoribacter lunatus TaxID=2941335 RepID=UPI00203A81C3|nr:DUF6057 family protein [Odoribacter lunatus]
MKRLHYILWGFLFLLYFFCYYSVLSHVLFYHEQHHLFLFSWDYFWRSVASEGIISYLTDFIIQFFYIPELGSGLLALIIASVYPLCYQIVRKILGWNDLLQLSVIPSLGLFFYTLSADRALTLVTGCFLTLLFLYLLLVFVQQYWKIFPLFKIKYTIRQSVRIGLTLCFLAGYAGFGYRYFVRNYKRSERIMLKAEQYVKSKEWDKVLTYTSRYWKSGRTNQLIAYFHHLALYHTGQLSYRLFDFPQVLGVKSLYFPWNSDSRESEYGHFLYEELGYINEAQRWEFEAMVVWGETAPHLLNLARYNILNGRPRVAQHFINKLKLSLFYYKEALELEKQLNGTQLPDMRDVLADVQEQPARFANVLNIGPELEYLCQHDTTHRMAFEYLMSYLLLSNHIPRFVKNLKEFRYLAPTPLPPAYEEALYIYKLGVSEEEFSRSGFMVSPETERRFKRYYALAQGKKTQALQAEFGKTYWFYLNYISPYGSKVVTR